VLDEWFEDVVKSRMTGACTLVRFADDFVMTFKSYHDAKRVLEVLGKRLDRYGLTLHPDKTRLHPHAGPGRRPGQLTLDEAKAAFQTAWERQCPLSKEGDVIWGCRNSTSNSSVMSKK
jgi:hypothetical protein